MLTRSEEGEWGYAPANICDANPKLIFPSQRACARTRERRLIVQIAFHDSKTKRAITATMIATTRNARDGLLRYGSCSV